jgi:hypothetical protein
MQMAESGFMRQRAPSKSLSVRHLAVSLVIGLLAQACAAEHAATGSPSSVAAADQEVHQLPRGAIQVGEELYQVPIGADHDGCARFRMYSPTKLVAQAIYYRDAAGGFTPSKEEAACASKPSN